MMAAGASSRSRRRRLGVLVGMAALTVTGVLIPVAAHAAEPSADLSVAVTHTPDAATTGDVVTVTVTAHNDGPDTAESVVAGLGFSYPLQLNTVPANCKRSANYDSIVCDLGDLAAGADASVQVPLQTRGRGLFTLPAAVASDTADPDSTDRTASAILLVKPGPTQAVRYISGIVPIILDRPADSATLNYWAPRWKAENERWPRNLAKIPAGLINSNEYRRLRIRESYTRILGRPADPSALTFWVNKAASGWSYERIERNLLGSREFLSHGDVEGNVIALYQAVLRRTPTQAELDKWVDILTPSNDVVSWADVVKVVQISTEGYDAIIQRIYLDTTGEPPSALGRYVWQVRLREGRSPESLWAQLLVSNEVLRNYPYTDDDYPEYEYAVPVATVQKALSQG